MCLDVGDTVLLLPSLVFFGILMPISCVGICVFQLSGTHPRPAPDLLCQRPVRIMHAHAEIYASTAILAALAYVLAKRAGLRLVYRIAIGLSVAVSSRCVDPSHTQYTKYALYIWAQHNRRLQHHNTRTHTHTHARTFAT